MASHVQQAQNVIDWYLLGTTGGSYYTVVAGETVVYVGTDADGNANRLVPVTDVSEHKGDGLAGTNTADVSYTAGACKLLAWPVRVLTDNVAAATPPEAAADKRVYLLDAGTWSDTDTNSGLHSYGECLQVVASGEYSGLYELNLRGPDWPA